MDLDQRLQASRAGAGSGVATDAGEQDHAAKSPQDAAAAPPVTPPPARPAVTAANDASGRQAAYQKAFNLLKDSKYTDAIKELKAFVATYPSGEFTDNAYYWLGEAQYVNHELPVARDTFRDMIKKFPQSSKVADALLKIAYIEYDSAQYANARNLLNDVITRYPTSSAARMAEKRLEKMRSEKH